MKQKNTLLALSAFLGGLLLSNLVLRERDSNKILAQLSAGDLMDKITILENKIAHLDDQEKKDNCIRELSALKEAQQHSLSDSQKLKKLTTDLFTVNQKLWDIEDQIRSKEAKQEFDDEFIELARAVYRNNRQRHALKRDINLHTDSPIIEEKQYTEFA